MVILFFIAIIGCYLFIGFFISQTEENTSSIIKLGSTGPTGPVGHSGISGSLTFTGPTGPQGVSGAINPIKKIIIPFNNRINEANQLFYWNQSDNEEINIFCARMEGINLNSIPIEVIFTCDRLVNISLQLERDDTIITSDFLQIPSTKSRALPGYYSSNYCGFDYRLMKLDQNVYGETGITLLAQQYYLFIYIIADELSHFGNGQYNGYILNAADNHQIRPGGEFTLLYYNPVPQIIKIRIYGNDLTYLQLTSVEAFSISGTQLLSPDSNVSQTSTFDTSYGPVNAVTPGSVYPSILGNISTSSYWQVLFNSSEAINRMTISCIPTVGVPYSTLNECTVVVYGLGDQIVSTTLLGKDPVQSIHVYPFFSNQ